MRFDLRCVPLSARVLRGRPIPSGLPLRRVGFPAPHAVSSTTGGSPNFSYAYDCNGNTITRTVGATAYTLTYDTENRLTGVSGGATATFVYDGDGNRVKTTIAGTTTAYIGNYYELTGSAYKKYYYAGAQRVALNDNGTLKWLLGDHLGSTSITANGTTGALLTELRYKPWGENRYTSGNARVWSYQPERAIIATQFRSAGVERPTPTRTNSLGGRLPLTPSKPPSVVRASGHRG